MQFNVVSELAEYITQSGYSIATFASEKKSHVEPHCFFFFFSFFTPLKQITHFLVLGFILKNKCFIE